MKRNWLGRRSCVIDTRIVDANVILRYLLADHPELSTRAKAFFDEVRAGELDAYACYYRRCQATS